MKVIHKKPVPLEKLEQGEVFKLKLEDETMYIYLGERDKKLQEAGYRCNCAALDVGYLWTFEKEKLVYPVQGAFVEGAEE